MSAVNPIPQPAAGPETFGARGLVVDIDHFAIHDGPGIRTAVYLKGCPLHCAWCHSPETQSLSPELLYLPQKCTACGLCLDVCEQGALSLQAAAGQVTVDRRRCTACDAAACTTVCYPGALKMAGTWRSAAEMMALVEKDRPFFAASGGGVTLTGGEATTQPAFACQFLSGCHALGIHTALETNGCAPWPLYQELLEVVDLFLYDLKHMDDARHRQLTGVSNHLVLSNLRRLAKHGAAVIVRVPCIPGVNDDRLNIQATAAFVRQVGLQDIQLLPYNVSAGAKYQWLGRNYALKEKPAQSREHMEALAAICRAQGLTALVQA